jgi:hypothetical protein
MRIAAWILLSNCALMAARAAASAARATAKIGWRSRRRKHAMRRANCEIAQFAQDLEQNAPGFFDKCARAGGSYAAFDRQCFPVRKA